MAKLALDGITGIFEFPRPMVNRPGLDFSFSGLKTAVKNTIAELSIVNELDSQARANIACVRGMLLQLAMLLGVERELD